MTKYEQKTDGNDDLVNKNEHSKASLLAKTQSRLMGVEINDNRNGSSVDYLTLKQRQRIVKTWRAIQDRRQLGRQIYIQIFMHKPSLKGLFSFRNITAEKLHSDPYFGRQGALFADFLHSIVGFVQLNDEKRLRETCKRIGNLHARMTKVNFEPDWWRLFVSSTLDCLQPYYQKGFFLSLFVNRAECTQAWNVLLSHVVDIMTEAYYETAKELLNKTNARDVNEENRLPLAVVNKRDECDRKFSTFTTSSEQHIVVTMIDDSTPTNTVNIMTSMSTKI